MLPVRVFKRPTICLGFVTGMLLCAIGYLLFSTEDHKTWVTELLVQMFPTENNATKVIDTHTMTLNDIEDFVPDRPNEDENEIPHNTNLVYVGENPLCTHEQLLPSCSSIREAPAKRDLKIQKTALSYEQLAATHGKDLGSGGFFRPRNCASSEKVAIIIPYRERPEHLKIFLNHIHPFLKKQKIEYMIIVVEQDQGSRMNRGMLRNIGFVEGLKICNFTCFIFNDIDTIPLREANYYTCGKNPRHHAASLRRFNFKMPYTKIFGGVVSFKKELFQKTNGYSNVYFNWGGEDDDLFHRLTNQNMTVERYPMDVSRYGDLTHVLSPRNNERVKYLYQWRKRAKTDGLNSLIYKRHLIEFRKLYTWIYVGIDEKEVLQQQGLEKTN